MENSDSYAEVMGNANLFRNANFGALQEKANMKMDKQKQEKEEIEGITMPFEVPVLEHYGAKLGKRLLKKAGIESEEGDSITRTLAKKGLSTLLEKAGLKKPDVKPDGKPDVKPEDEEEDIPDVADDIQKDMDTSKISSDEDIQNAKDFLRGRTENFTDPEQRQEIAEDILRNKPHEVASNTQEQAENLESDQNIIRKAEEDDSIEKGENEPEDVPEGLEKESEDALGEEPDLLSGAKSALSDAISDGKSAISDVADSGLSSITSGLKDAASGLKDTVSSGLKDAASGLKDTVSTGLKDTVSSLKGSGKTLAEKLAEKAGAVEAEGGGPEDLGADIGSAALAVGALIASVFGKHISHPNLENQESTVVATQGYGLREQ